MVTLPEYQTAVGRTCATTDGQETLKLALVGLQDELGELAGPLKKYLWHGHTLDSAHLQEEVGDVLWYLATLCNALGLSLEAALEGNIQKLHQRYPNGFSSEKSLHRTSADKGGSVLDPDALARLHVMLWAATNDALGLSLDTPLSSEQAVQLGVQLGRFTRVLARKHIYPFDETDFPPHKED